MDQSGCIFVLDLVFLKKQGALVEDFFVFLAGNYEVGDDLLPFLFESFFDWFDREQALPAHHLF